MRWWALILLGAECLWVLPPSWAQGDPNSEQTFAGVFASVLVGENPDGGNWGSPGDYLKAASGRALPSPEEIRRTLRPPVNEYRLLIVPGFLSACSSTALVSAPAFQQAQEHLKANHGVDVALLQVPDDSCENNGILIAKYLRQHARDGKKYIVVGHSKGAADLQAALQDPEAVSAVAALVSVAGAVSGSPVADVAGQPGLLGNVAISLGCAGKLGPALQSLRVPERRAFLKSHPNPPVPSYSLVAVSDYSSTSQALRATWLLLGAGLRPEDGLLIAADGALPGARFLGTALADHVAVAHDFRNTAFANLFNKGSFPRDALLEALVRFVIADLENHSAPGSGRASIKIPSGNSESFASGKAMKKTRDMQFEPFASPGFADPGVFAGKTPRDGRQTAPCRPNGLFSGHSPTVLPFTSSPRVV